MQECLLGLAALLSQAEPARTQTGPDPLAELRTHVRSGADDAALSQLDQLALTGGETPALAYLRARLHERKNQLRAALGALPGDLSTFPDEVASDVARRRALWQASEGFCSQAQPAWVRWASPASCGVGVLS